MMAIRGATIDAADAALAKSAPSRRPRFLVFHCCWSLEDGISTASLLGIGIGEAAGAAASGFSTALLSFIAASEFVTVYSDEETSKDRCELVVLALLK